MTGRPLLRRSVSCPPGVAAQGRGAGGGNRHVRYGEWKSVRFPSLQGQGGGVPDTQRARFIAPAAGQPFFLPFQFQQCVQAQDRRQHPRLPAEGPVQVLQQIVHHVAEPIVSPVPLSHRPDGPRVGRAQRSRIPGDTVADAGIRVVPVGLPAFQHRSDQAVEAGAVDLEIAAKGPKEKFFLPAVPDVRVAVVEAVLAVGVGGGELRFGQERAVAAVPFVQGRARVRRVEHELVEIGVVAHGVVDDAVHVLRGVGFQADDRRAQDADAVVLQLHDETARVHVLELSVTASLALQPHPDPDDPHAHQLLHRVGLQDPGGAEDVQGPALAVSLHQLQKPEGALAVQEEVFVEHEKRSHAELLLDLAHDGEELVARFVEVDELPLAPEEGRRGAEVTAHGTPHRGDQNGRRAPRVLRQVHPQDAGAEPRVDHGVADGGLVVLAEKPPQPRDPVSLDDVIGVEDALQALPAGDVAAHDDGCAGEVLADQFAHFPRLARIRDDGADPHDVVGVLADLADEALERRVVQDGAGGVGVGLQHAQGEGGMEHPQGEPSLDAGDLVLIELHGVDPAAPVLVVLRVRPEDAGEQDAGPVALGVPGVRCVHGIPFRVNAGQILHARTREGKRESGFYNSFTKPLPPGKTLRIDTGRPPLYGSSRGTGPAAPHGECP